MSSSSSAVVKPTVVFVPGAFHTPSHFQDFSEFLQKSSYPSVAVALPSIGGQASTANLDDDVGAIRSVLTQLVEDEKDVILVVHSYGGVPGCQTVRGLEKSTLMKEGQKGGVVQVLFIAAFVLEQGQCVVEVLGGGLPPWARAEVSSNDTSQCSCLVDLRARVMSFIQPIPHLCSTINSRIRMLSISLLCSVLSQPSRQRCPSRMFVTI